MESPVSAVGSCGAAAGGEDGGTAGIAIRAGGGAAGGVGGAGGVLRQPAINPAVKAIAPNTMMLRLGENIVLVVNHPFAPDKVQNHPLA